MHRDAWRCLVSGVESPYGLYFRSKSADGQQAKFAISQSAAISLISAARQVVGVKVELRGMSFVLVTGGDTKALALTHVYRPSHINFFSGQRVVSLALVWPNWRGKVVWLSHGKPDAPLPAD